jgi:hypothetical protein
MKTARRVFITSAIFSATIAAVYWYLTREPAGTMLLGFMAGALIVVAVYMTFAELDANLLADNPDATMAQAAGEHVGTYITRSTIPFGIGLVVTGVLLGLVISPAAAGLAIAAFIGLICLMILESR